MAVDWMALCLCKRKRGKNKYENKSYEELHKLISVHIKIFARKFKQLEEDKLNLPEVKKLGEWTTTKSGTEENK